MTPDDKHSPEGMSPSDTARHRENPVRRVATWVGSGFAGDRQRRVSPKTRSIQLGAAAAAFGAVGVLALQTGHEPPAEAEPVQPAAQAAALQPAAADHDRAAADHERSKQDQDKKQRGGKAAAKAEGAEPQQAKAAPPAKDQIDTWISEAVGLMNKHGEQLDQSDHEAIRTIIENESAGDPGAKNDWDSNASAGTPSIGLMQTIQPTFDSFALPGRDDIYDPVDNIVAATRYAVDRYGGPSEVPGVEGLNSGSSYQGY